MKEKVLKWLRAAGVRAIKTVAQTAVATIGTGAVISEVDWRMVLSASILAGVLSLLTSVAGLPEIKELSLIHILREEPLQQSCYARNSIRIEWNVLFACRCKHESYKQCRNYSRNRWRNLYAIMERRRFQSCASGDVPVL